MDSSNENELVSAKSNLLNRREFLTQTSALTAGVAIAATLTAREIEKLKFPEPGKLIVKLTINGKVKTVETDPRSTLLDTLREQIHLTGTKKGCDRGQCGACTVLLDGKRINSCLQLTAMCQGKSVITIEGVASGGKLHPIQQSFLKHDAFQCGYCTPGQICSAIGMISEGHATDDNDIRELMSGNICRCGAYQNILEAIKEVIHHS